MLIDKELPVSCSHVTDYFFFFFFNSMVTVHIKPTAPHHTTMLTASVKKKNRLLVLSNTLFLLDYRKTCQRWNPGTKWTFYPMMQTRMTNTERRIWQYGERFYPHPIKISKIIDLNW